jgi:hypothetical protein
MKLLQHSSKDAVIQIKCTYKVLITENSQLLILDKITNICKPKWTINPCIYILQIAAMGLEAYMSNAM